MAISAYSYASLHIEGNGREEIEAQIEAYGQAAKLVKDSGLDGVDLHGTHGALISEFLSKIMNKRKDRWGDR